ncbi:MAG TPA: ribose 5-phosphate isomerase B [Candidatus Stercoripulliclostridium merdigallinarum]|uniref:Ribose 5-phosphate isomerase B n=1 Tax=Candidatus Stercoripulliclostridium merdigallinarum TaxID=2840951 RepID=A0A9D1MH50_9FIRM|nr:ribose 5-phosphate isomerase B [Candidatus Stercoripulliclostridium merdigallinarum]
MKVAIGCDHGGINLKEAVIKAVTEQGMEYEDFGTYTDESVDYPDYAEKVGRAVASGAADLGVVLCGTGIGISIAANKIKGIRCAHVTDAFQAEMCRQHNDANVLAMGGRITSPEDAYKFTKIFLTTPFAGGRHLRRVEKIAALEK